MPFKIITDYIPQQNYHLGAIPIDLSRKTGVLIRQSMKNADKDHYESRMLQENLVPLAIKSRGDTDDRNVLVYDEGAGISGTKGYDERPKLSKLYLDIANNITGSLFLARPDRLFRDKHFLNVGMFTELAERKKLILIVPGKRIYDFTKYADLEAFQKDMQDAYKYIATHIQYMLDTRDQKRKRGLYVGGTLSAPYVIDRTVWKDEQKPIIYQPWLDPALDLFTRFKAFDFSIAHICRYIESLPYIFREPSFEDMKRYMFCTKMYFANGGYSFSCTGNVGEYLSNLALGGYMKIGKDEEGNDLFLPNAFEAAIPYDLLDKCFAAITGHHIDGSPFEGLRNTKQRYMRSNPEGPHGILHTLIAEGRVTSNQGHMGVHTDTKRGNHEYKCNRELQEEGYGKTIKHLNKSAVVWNLPMDLDRVILDRLYALSQQDPDMAERVKTIFDSLKGQEINTSTLLQQQAEETAKRITRLDFLLTTPTIPLDEETAIKYAAELAELRPKLARINQKIQAQPDIDPEATITNFYFVLANLSTEFEKQGIDVQKQMMSKLIEQVRINNISPHLFHLYIEWKDGIATRPDVALLWRGRSVKTTEWTDEEDAALRMYWPEGSELEIMRHLPKRSRNVMIHRASTLQVARLRDSGREKAKYDSSMTFLDLEAARQYAEASKDENTDLSLGPIPEHLEEMQAYLCEKVNELATATKRGKVSAYWPLPVDIVSFCPIVTDEGGETIPRTGRQAGYKAMAESYRHRRLQLALS